MARVFAAATFWFCKTPHADVIELDMFRAMTGASIGKLDTQNDDTADLTGVLKYVHTEVIAEHTLSPPDRKGRKYDIDALAMWRWKIQNSEDLLTDNRYAQFVDFGPFLAFDFGQATIDMGDEIVRSHGDYVGVQLQYNDARFALDYPFYWYTATGFCPNLPWKCTRGYFDPDTHEPCMNSVPPTHRCPPEQPCPGKGTPDSPNKQCIKYDSSGDVAKGGLCKNFKDPDFKGPTGDLGCTYSYATEATKVMLDDLVGITQEDCGDRKCTNWLDFRQNCKDKNLKRQFNPITHEIETVQFCVEYDIHPDCVNSCDTAACKAIPSDKVELGLPFWQGRCHSQRNLERAEMLAAKFGIENAQTGHNIVKKDLQKKQAPCVVPGRASVCSPDAQSGGPYCSRRWSGVCTLCYIPGTKMIYPANATQPTCPVDILTSANPDYGPGSSFNRPECKTTKARDLCCLYSNSCDGETDPAKVGFHDDGLAIVTFKSALDGTSDALINYYKRIAADAGFGEYVADQAALEKLAYWSWQINHAPVNFTDVKPRLEHLFTHVKPPSPSGAGGANVGLIVGIIVVVLIMAAIVAWACSRRKQAQARDALLEIPTSA